MLDGDFARAWDVSDRVMRQRRGQSCESCAEMLADRHAVDLVHINGYAQARLESGRPSIAVAHSDVLSWWLAVHGEPAPAAWHDYRRQVVCGLRAAACVVAPTRAVQDGSAARITGCRCATPRSFPTASMSPHFRRVRSGR